MAFALALAACNQAPPDEGRREASLPPMPAPVATPVRPALRAIWAFESSNDQCSARAAAGGLSLLAAVRRDTPIRLTIIVPAELPTQSTAVRLAFTGGAGRWQLTGQRIGGHQILVILGSDEAALSRVLLLLSGGVLKVGDPARPLAALELPGSDAQGQHWFDCARGIMI